MEYTGDELFWIAICDDEKDSIKEIKDILMEGEAEPGEFKISVFPSGAALMNANVDRYDLLILDMVFPGENGREIACEYRNRNKDGMFVFCTGIQIFRNYFVLFLILPQASLPTSYSALWSFHF